MSIKWKAAVAGSVVGALALAGCGGSSGAADSASSLSLVGFSILEQANKQVIADWGKTTDGKGVTFKQSYGASGDQSRAVEGGQKADIVHLSLEPDVQRLVDAKLVSPDWNKTATKGILTQSVVVIVVRKGNPKGIKTWDDLVKPGVKIVTPNPASSGSAKWNILAAYGHVLANGGTDAQAQAYLKKFFGNVAALRLHRPRPGPADREPGRGHHRRQPQGQEVPDLPHRQGGPDRLRRGGLPSAGQRHQGRRQGRERPEQPVPDPAQAADHRQGLRRLDRGEHQVLRREGRHRHQDPVRDLQAVTQAVITPGR